MKREEILKSLSLTELKVWRFFFLQTLRETEEYRKAVELCLQETTEEILERKLTNNRKYS